ncbi:MAG: Smr/MutS family protein [Arenibacterium sp.]
MTRRKLTQEEIELWHKVAAQAEPLTPSDRRETMPLPKPKPVKKPVARVAKELKPAEPKMVERVKPAVAMDRKAFGRMKRGKLVPEGRIDLHGMTLDQAHPALIRFILNAQASGKRLVLVITGKGKQSEDTGPIPRPRGILKRQVPHWLEIPPLAQAVLQVTPAHIRHGGDGALYVYLKRGR